MFLCFASLLALVVLLCCCFRFRIPRTKQEIEADYVRKKIARKFQKQLKAIANTDMDDMNLKKALDRVRAELKSDSESPPASEASGSSAGRDPAHDGGQPGTCADEPDSPWMSQKLTSRALCPARTFKLNSQSRPRSSQDAREEGRQPETKPDGVAETCFSKSAIKRQDSVVS